MNKYRIGTDIPFRLSINDSGVMLDWSAATVRQVAMYSDDREAFAGACTYAVDGDDATLLDCIYPASAQLFTGALRVVIIFDTSDGRTLTYDLADVFALVDTSEEADSDGDTVTDATVTVSTLPISTVALILEACVSATAAATEAAAAANAATDGFMAEMERMRMRMTPLTLEAGPGGAVISIYSYNESVAREVEVSVDGGVTWDTFTSSPDGTEICDLAAGGTVMLRGEGVASGVFDEDEGEYVNGCSIIIESGTASAYGNPMSLLDKTSFPYMTAVPAGAFAYLFSTYDGTPDNAGKLYTHASHSVVLPATTLASSCYSSMFQGCTGLTAAPELPATTLESNCYSSMFDGCTSLTTAPELPATTLAIGCYYAMFKNCRLVARIVAMFTTTPSTIYTRFWVQGVAAEGVFVKNAAATWNVTGDNGIPSGWTVEEREV